MINFSEEEVAMEIQLDLEEGRLAKETAHFDELDLRIVDCEPQKAPVEELKSLIVISTIRPSPCKLAKACHWL